MSIAPKIDTDIARQQLTDHESVMKRCWQDFATRLAIIRDERLYLIEFKTFEEYCTARWGISKRAANYQIQSGQVVNELVNSLGTIVPNEGTAREFVKVPKEDRSKVAESAKAVAAESGRETINSRDVKEAKKRIYDPTPKVVESIANEDDGEPIQPKDDEPPIEIVDDPEAWLEKLPLMDVLTGMPKRKYVEAAKLWVEMEPQMKQTAAAIRRASKAIPQHMHSRFMTRMLVSFIIDAPQHWTLCKPCNGTGQVPKIGACDVCRSDGFNISTSRTR